MSETSLLHDLIARRWSPRAFQDKPIDAATLGSLFEAARWSASCYNEQPWRFVVATKDHPEQFERVLGTLMPMNQAWAKTAWALAISAGKKTFTHNGTPNKWGIHDTGAALASMMLQATSAGLHIHAMGGFDPAKARAEFGIPEDFEPAAAIAIGYIDGAPDPPAERSRHKLDEQVFGTEWGKVSTDIGL
jgi:nitroreductase